MVPWRFCITYIVIIFTTLLWFFLDPRSLPKLPNFGTPSFCNPRSTVFTGHILLDVCPSTRTRSMYRGLRDGRSSTLPLPAAIIWLCHGWDFAPPPSTSHVCLAECCTGLGHSVKASWVPICPAVSGKRQSLVVIPHLGVCQSFCPLVCRESWALVGEGCGVAVSFTAGHSAVL